MQTVKIGADTYRLPFVDLLPPLTADELAGLRANIEANGVLVPAAVYDSDQHGANCIIDGGHRATIAAELKIDLPTRRLKKLSDLQARTLAWGLNLHRRHLTPKQQQAIRADRVKRVAAKRADGMSFRTIAEEEGISEKQAREDFKASGAEGSAPETVTGKDGKTYSSTKQVSSPEGDSDDTSDDAPEAETTDGMGENDPAGASDEAQANTPDDEPEPAEASAGPARFRADPGAVVADPMARIESFRADFGALVKTLKLAGATLSRLLEHHQAGYYLRRMESDDGRAMFVDRPRTRRGDKLEGGWHSDDLARLLSAVQQAKVDRPCMACRGAGCLACYEAGFVPAEVAAFRASPRALDLTGAES